MHDQHLRHSDRSAWKRFRRRLAAAVPGFVLAFFRSIIGQWALLGSGTLTTATTVLVAAFTKHLIFVPTFVIGAVLLVAGGIAAHQGHRRETARDRLQRAHDEHLHSVSDKVAEVVEMPGELKENLCSEVYPFVANGIAMLLEEDGRLPNVEVGLAEEIGDGQVRLMFGVEPRTGNPRPTVTVRLISETLEHLLARTAQRDWRHVAYASTFEVSNRDPRTVLFVITSVHLNRPGSNALGALDRLDEVANTLRPVLRSSAVRRSAQEAVVDEQ